MTYFEAYSAIDCEGRRLDSFLDKIDLMIEASGRELELNCEEAELKVLKENGTDSDLIYLKEAASEGYINKVQRAIQKAIEAVVTFIASIASKAKEAFLNAKSKAALKNAQNMVKTNPKLKGKKIEFHSTKNEVAALDEAMNKKFGLLAKCKSGTFKKEDGKKFDQIEMAKEAKIRKSKAAIMVSVTIAAAVSIGLYTANKLSKDNGKDFEKSAQSAQAQIKNDTEEILSWKNKIIASLARDRKRKAAAEFAESNEIFRKIKSIFKGNKKTVTINGTAVAGVLEDMQSDYKKTGNAKKVMKKYDKILAKECCMSIEDAQTMLEAFEFDNISIEDDMMYEGVNLDARKAFKATKKEYAKSLKQAKKFIKAKQYDEAIKELTSVKGKVVETLNYIKDLDSTLGSTILGMYVNNMIYMLKVLASIIISVPTLGLSVFITQLYECITWLKGIIDTVDDKGFNKDALNTYKNRLIQGTKLINKSIDNMIKKVNRLKKEESSKTPKKVVKESVGAFDLDQEYENIIAEQAMEMDGEIMTFDEFMEDVAIVEGVAPEADEMEEIDAMLESMEAELADDEELEMESADDDDEDNEYLEFVEENADFDAEDEDNEYLEFVEENADFDAEEDDEEAFKEFVSDDDDEEVTESVSDEEFDLDAYLESVDDLLD